MGTDDAALPGVGTGLPSGNWCVRLNPRISVRTEEFAERWVGVAFRAAAGERVWEDERVGDLIANRERQLKGGRARLLPENLPPPQGSVAG